MSSEPRRMTPELRAELDAWENSLLPSAEFEARVRAPWTERETEDFEELVGWFRRRHPGALERLRAIRHRVQMLRQRAR